MHSGIVSASPFVCKVIKQNKVNGVELSYYVHVSYLVAM